MFKQRKRMLMAATALVVGLTFNGAAQAHNPDQPQAPEFPNAPIIDTLTDIETAMLALDFDQHFCEKNEETSAALEAELQALIDQAVKAYSQHTAFKATLKKIVTEGYGGDASQFEDSAYFQDFENKFLDIRQIEDEILIELNDDMTGPCSSPDEHGDAHADVEADFSEPEEVSEFEQDVAILLGGFALETTYDEVNIPDLPSQFCDADERDAFSRRIFRLEQQRHR